MRKTNVLRKIIVLALILALPGFLYYLLTVKGKNRYEPLSYFGPKQLAKTSHTVKGKVIPDTIYHAISDFTLTDQYGKQVSLKSFSGKIIIVNFFYTNCPTICNQVSQGISKLAAGYAKNNMIYFASITVDPQRDSIGALKVYADKYNSVYKMANAAGDTTATVKTVKTRFNISNHWLFLSGDTSVIYPLARNGFLVNALNAGNGNFIYSDKIMMIDSHKHIRGYYSGTSADDMDRLDNEIRVQVSEELRNSGTPLY
jgi:protein SCO1/2